VPPASHTLCIWLLLHYQWFRGSRQR